MTLQDIQIQLQRRLRTYTVRELCKILKFDKKKVYSLLQSGELVGRKTAASKTGRWRVSEEEVIRYLTDNNTQVSQKNPVSKEVGNHPGE